MNLNLFIIVLSGIFFIIINIIVLRLVIKTKHLNKYNYYSIWSISTLPIMVIAIIAIIELITENVFIPSYIVSTVVYTIPTFYVSKIRSDFRISMFEILFTSVVFFFLGLFYFGRIAILAYFATCLFSGIIISINCYYNKVNYTKSKIIGFIAYFLIIVFAVISLLFLPYSYHG